MGPIDWNLIEQAKKHPYSCFDIPDEQLKVILKEQPELIVVADGAMLVLESINSAEIKLHWAADDTNSLVDAIHRLRGNVQAEFTGKWRLCSFYPDFVDPLLRIGFEIDSHYMDYWLYGVLGLSLSAFHREYIRSAVSSDCNRLSEISAECISAPGWLEESVKWFTNWLADKDSGIFVVEQAGKVAGYCCVNLYGFDSEKGTVVWIRELAVSLAYQGQGLGRALLLAGLEWGQSDGAQRSFVAVDKRNNIARKLYESVGFCPSGAEEINLILI